MKKILRKSKRIIYPLSLFLCFFITHFVFLNSYEIVFGKDSSVKYIKALNHIQINSIVDSLLAEDTYESFIHLMRQKGYRGNFGRPEVMKIPRISAQLPLTEAIGEKNSEWFARSNNAHYLIFDEGSNGNIGNLIIYVQKNWRTVSEVLEIRIGDNVFLDTKDEWRYMFRISESASLNFDEKYVLGDSDEASLIFVVEDSSNELNYVYKADFVSIQNMQR